MGRTNTTVTPEFNQRVPQGKAFGCLCQADIVWYDSGTGATQASVFFEKAPTAAAVPLDSQGRPLVMDPAKVNEPLWIFADQIDLLSVSGKIHDAQAAERPIVILGADVSSIGKVFRQPIDTTPSAGGSRTAWSRLPWMTQRPTLSSMLAVPDDSLSTEGQYYAFMVDSTVALAPPDMAGG